MGIILQGKSLKNIWREMNFNEYQKLALETVSYPEPQAVFYPVLGLSGECGEIANKVKKVMRGDPGADFSGVSDELGDVLWYLAAIATDLGTTLEEIANKNIEKLFDRRTRGVIKGSGDNR